LLRAWRMQSAHPGDRGVASIRRNQGSRLERFLARRDFPVIRARIRRRKRCDSRRFKNRGPVFPRAFEEDLIEEAAFDRDLGIVAPGKWDTHGSSSNANELDATQPAVRRPPNA